MFGFLVAGYFLALLAIPAAFIGYLGVGSMLTYLTGASDLSVASPLHVPTATIAVLAVVFASVVVTSYSAKKK
ncbi:MAG: hypothetical protein R6U44_06905 [Archaeoglobaceae archaeon]